MDGEYRKLQVHLAWQHRRKLAQLMTAGVQPVRVVRRALVLSQLDQGVSASQVAAALQMPAKAVRETGFRYNADGLDRALYEKPRPGAKPLLSENERQRIVAMVCSSPPEGRARWTVRLIAEEAVKRNLVGRAGRETIRILLQHHLQPWRKKCGVSPSLMMSTSPVWKMCSQSTKNRCVPTNPVVCVDEKPVALHKDVREPVPMKPGSVARRDNEYERCGTANVFCGVEPQAEVHFTKVTPNRSLPEFAEFLNSVASHYPEARTIHLVMDNLSSHTRKALADHFGEQQGAKLWDRFTVHYTPGMAAG